MKDTSRQLHLWRAHALLVPLYLIAVHGTTPSYAQERQSRIAPIPESVHAEKDVAYGKGGGRDLLLDLYRPRGEGKGRPGVIFIHGGGWRGGTRDHFQRQAVHLAERGYVCACISYRLSGEATFPAALEDCKCAVRWLKAQSQKYDLDTSRIAAVGGSAGGHLAALVAVSHANAELEGEGGHPELSSQVHAAAAFNGAFDLVDAGKKDPAKRSLVSFLGGDYETVPELYAKASPIRYIDTTSPPFLLFHGTADTTVPYQQSVDFKQALRNVGVTVSLVTAQDQKHGYFNSSPHFESTLERLETFLDRELRGP